MPKFLYVFFLMLTLMLAGIHPLWAQTTPKKKTNQENKSDFNEIKVNEKVVLPSDSAFVPAIFMNLWVDKNGNTIAKADSLVASDKGNERMKGRLFGRQFPRIGTQGNILQEGGSNMQQLRNALRQYYSTGAYGKDSLLLKNFFAEPVLLIDEMDLTVQRSMLREDTTDLYETDEEDIVIVNEEIAVDSVWITIASYYSIWDSHNINPYKYDISQFKDSVSITLFDSTALQYWSPPLTSTKVTSNFGFRRWRWHHGIDLNLNAGDSVLAAFDGIVRVARFERSGYGNFIVIRHYNGLETLYGHLSKQLVKPGDYVKAGDIIGKGGSTGRSTGPHLHYEVRYNGYAFDPSHLYDFEQNTLLSDIFTLAPRHFEHLTNQRQSVLHIVKSGDSLSRIAQRYRTTIAQLCRLNGISTKTTLRVGQRLRVR